MSAILRHAGRAVIALLVGAAIGTVLGLGLGALREGRDAVRVASLAPAAGDGRNGLAASSSAKAPVPEATTPAKAPMPAAATPAKAPVPEVTTPAKAPIPEATSPAKAPAPAATTTVRRAAPKAANGAAASGRASRPARPVNGAIQEAKQAPAPKWTPGLRAPAWRRNAVAIVPADGRPMIAIVIDDLGVDKRRSARAIALPGPLTAAFLPYATQLDRQIEAARRAGHEILVHLPMEPWDRTVDPGPRYLATDQAVDEIKALLDWNLAHVPRHVGVSNHMGSRFTGDVRAMRVVLGELSRRGLLFLDSVTSGATVGRQVARGARVPFAGRDVFLDNERTAPRVAERLAELERIARRRGYAVGISHPHDATIDVLSKWLPAARRRGLALVPISVIAGRGYDPEPSPAAIR